MQRLSGRSWPACVAFGGFCFFVLRGLGFRTQGLGLAVGGLEVSSGVQRVLFLQYIWYDYYLRFVLVA